MTGLPQMERLRCSISSSRSRAPQMEANIMITMIGVLLTMHACRLGGNAAWMMSMGKVLFALCRCHTPIDDSALIPCLASALLLLSSVDPLLARRPQGQQWVWCFLQENIVRVLMLLLKNL